MSSEHSGDGRQHQPGYPDRESWVRARTYSSVLAAIGTVLIGIAGLAISYRQHEASRSAEEAAKHDRALSELGETTRQNDSEESERRKTAFLLLGNLSCKMDERTKIAMATLEKIPEEARYTRVFADALSSTCPNLNGSQASYLREQGKSGAVAEVGGLFLDSLRNAWIYRSYGLYDAAELSFMRAANKIPSQYVDRVDFSELELARQSDSNGRIKEAVDHYAKAFGKINVQ